MLFYSSGVPQVQIALGKPLGERFPQASDGGQARDKAAEMVGASPAYVQLAATEKGIVLQLRVVTAGDLFTIGLFHVSDCRFLQQFSTSSVSKTQQMLGV